jgi:hypothetical protein
LSPLVPPFCAHPAATSATLLPSSPECPLAAWGFPILDKDFGFHVALSSLALLRQYVFLPVLVMTVPLMVVKYGADAQSVALNAVVRAAWPLACMSVAAALRACACVGGCCVRLGLLASVKLRVCAMPYVNLVWLARLFCSCWSLTTRCSCSL